MDVRAEERFWATVRRTLERMQETAPDGYTARVDVRLMGERFTPAVAQPVPPWIIFETEEDPPDRRVIAVRPEDIAHVEISYVRADGRRRPGFQVRPPDEDGLGLEP
jgi:hypothetical protein